MRSAVRHNWIRASVATTRAIFIFFARQDGAKRRRAVPGRYVPSLLCGTEFARRRWQISCSWANRFREKPAS